MIAIKQFEILRKTRQFLIDQVSDLSIEQVNRIPAGFSNNVAWNLGHMVAAQQGICYKRIGLELAVPEPFFESYKPGSKPAGPVTVEEYDAIKGLLFSSIDRFEHDFQNNVFSNYRQWTSRYGIDVTSIQDALSFVLFHDGLHFGYVTALKKIID